MIISINVYNGLVTKRFLKRNFLTYYFCLYYGFKAWLEDVIDNQPTILDWSEGKTWNKIENLFNFKKCNKCTTSLKVKFNVALRLLIIFSVKAQARDFEHIQDVWWSLFSIIRVNVLIKDQVLISMQILVQQVLHTTKCKTLHTRASHYNNEWAIRN